MKKFAAILLSLFTAFLLPLSVSADIGAPEFEDWFVLCGLDGYDFEDYDYDYENDVSHTYDTHIEPGVTLQVHSFSSSDKTYFLIISDDNFKHKGRGGVTVSEADFNRCFVDKKTVIAKEKGTKLPSEATGTVTSDNGIYLRQGPSTYFPRIKGIRYKAQLKYSYVYSYGGHNWAYTTYKGKSGWACIDYVASDAPQTSSSTESAAPEQDVDISLPEEALKGDIPQNEGLSSPAGFLNFSKFFSTTTVNIIACVLLCLILAGVAIWVLVVVYKKKKK